MKHATSLMIALAIGAGLLAVNSLAEPKSKAASTTPITLAELSNRGIEGSLGKPLGTVIEVSGVVVKNRSNAKSDVSEPYFLRIETVDGQPLPTAREIRKRDMPLDRDVPELKIGDRFKCVGYETGKFTGSPVDEFNDVPSDGVPAYAHQPFHFETHFAVSKAK